MATRQIPPAPLRGASGTLFDLLEEEPSPGVLPSDDDNDSTPRCVGTLFQRYVWRSRGGHGNTTWLSRCGWLPRSRSTELLQDPVSDAHNVHYGDVCDERVSHNVSSTSASVRLTRCETTTSYSDIHRGLFDIWFPSILATVSSTVESSVPHDYNSPPYSDEELGDNSNKPPEAALFHTPPLTTHVLMWSDTEDDEDSGIDHDSDSLPELIDDLSQDDALLTWNRWRHHAARHYHHASVRRCAAHLP